MPSAADTPDRLSAVVCHRDRPGGLPAIAAALGRCAAPVVELLIVDDGSARDARDVYERLAAEHPALGVRVLANPRNEGAAAARNRGLREARGSHVLMADSDAVFDPRAVDLLWSERRAADFVYPRADYEDGTRMNPRGAFERARVFNSVLFLVRAAALRRMDEWFDETMSIYGEDPDFFLRAHALGLTSRFVGETRAIHPVRARVTAEQFYLGWRNSIYLALKLGGLIPYRIPYPLFVAGQALRHGLGALSGRYFDGMRPTRRRFDAGRGTLLRLYFAAIAWNWRERPLIRRKRDAVRRSLRAARGGG